MKALLSIVFVFCFKEAAASNPLDEITACRKGDLECSTKTGKILMGVIVNGNEDLDIQRNDPIHQDSVEMDISTLKYKLRDVSTYGFTTCSVETAEITETFFNIDLLCKNFTVFGQYEINGTLLSLPLRGKGDFRVFGLDYGLKWKMLLKQAAGKDGKTHLAIKNFTFLADLKGTFEIYLGNLFDGQKELTDQFNKLMSENGKAAANEVQGPVFEANLKSFAKHLNKCFKYIPMDKILKE
ncbi:hypothetical protein K1T71_001371 [Dendrolimus kikuchii]|uniref:Uncharacterized protein n=1 Tax=Dendrolimus kikuchii TaxID=765133 RepID=A0ACC1DHS0_9NEOP|nr:hypothetical protein K1T71_001371 [Dendrolimus kikuchii]